MFGSPLEACDWTGAWNGPRCRSMILMLRSHRCRKPCRSFRCWIAGRLNFCRCGVELSLRPADGQPLATRRYRPILPASPILLYAQRLSMGQSRHVGATASRLCPIAPDPGSRCFDSVDGEQVEPIAGSVHFDSHAEQMPVTLQYFQPPFTAARHTQYRIEAIPKQNANQFMPCRSMHYSPLSLPFSLQGRYKSWLRLIKAGRGSFAHGSRLFSMYLKRRTTRSVSCHLPNARQAVSACTSSPKWRASVPNESP